MILRRSVELTGEKALKEPDEESHSKANDYFLSTLFNEWVACLSLSKDNAMC